MKNIYGRALNSPLSGFSTPHGLMTESQKSLQSPEAKLGMKSSNNRTSIKMKNDLKTQSLIKRNQSSSTKFDSNFLTSLSKFYELPSEGKDSSRKISKPARHHIRDLPSIKAKGKKQQLLENESKRFLKICNSSKNSEYFSQLRDKIREESKDKAQSKSLGTSLSNYKNVPQIINLDQSNFTSKKRITSHTGIMKFSGPSSAKFLKPEVLNMKARTNIISNALPSKFSRNPRKSLKLKFLGGNQKMLRAYRYSHSQQVNSSSKVMRRFGDLPLFPLDSTPGLSRGHPFVINKNPESISLSKNKRTKRIIARENIRNCLKIFNMKDVSNTRTSDASRTLSQCNKFLTIERDVIKEKPKDLTLENQFNPDKDLASYEISQDDEVYLQQSFGFKL
ncbi:unnamed protein product [Moneuplotes crassus]|uniref:Uncharacterized protein n=1 Tax=Euplotes crassus TaxID=5936 RepID=A0AAD1XEI8_EUPCR|nr:unnamed protein product [Moneuplotes crassus]